MECQLSETPHNWRVLSHNALVLSRLEPVFHCQDIAEEEERRERTGSAVGVRKREKRGIDIDSGPLI